MTKDGTCRRPGCKATLRRPVEIKVEDVLPVPEADKSGLRKLGANLRFLRAHLSYTAAQLADAAETTKPNISRIESGSMIPSAGMIEKLSLAMGITVGELLRPDWVKWLHQDELMFEIARRMRGLGEDNKNFILQKVHDLHLEGKRRARG
jgi:transcriptional regulator with XRE-family HTH domain